MWQFFMAVPAAATLVPLIGGYHAWSRGAYRQCAMALLIALPLCGLAIYTTWQFVTHPSAMTNANFGFGPEWQCTKLPNTEPVCIKMR